MPGFPWPHVVRANNVSTNVFPTLLPADYPCKCSFISGLILFLNSKLPKRKKS
ncbi:hypothetical protein BDV27DRAFT_139267 [Aspergillus caelatus]|uniref:Uncharacterized protein n=1 Tax=Aspergillus caelatus TaxID=61420 RepID=A0A5N6ZIM1_9EURO|nr:uncharacterized protein BDV27DRAFT_139267 [Aspergillus caelatus]KAE8357477.1 hypothetical protein BDV27DRAFT_139267 [Aspergillus caelatus]